LILLGRSSFSRSLSLSGKSDGSVLEFQEEPGNPVSFNENEELFFFLLLIFLVFCDRKRDRAVGCPQ